MCDACRTFFSGSNARFHVIDRRSLLTLELNERTEGIKGEYAHTFEMAHTAPASEPR
jgi:hypothetical protein